MKKHIFGLAIFSFIIGAAAIVYGFLNVLFPIPSENYVFTPEYYSAEMTSCLFKPETEELEIKPPVITQAVFNAKTKKLDWEIVAPKTNVLPILHFFAKDDKGVKYLDSIRSVNCISGEKSLKFSRRYRNLGKLSSQVNLYLIPDTTNTSVNKTEKHIIFDIDKAIPVTIDYGK